MKQALFANGRSPVTVDEIRGWAPFMAALRERDIPMAIHADLGNDADPFRYLPLMEEGLRLYPENRIVWLHLGLSKELHPYDPQRHVEILESLLRRYPHLVFDISWRVLYDNEFVDPAKRRLYADFMNRWPERFLTGTDLVASANKTGRSTGRSTS